MENFDTDGQFWVAGKPDRKVAGRLKFDAFAGLELTLIGSLHDPSDVLARQTGHEVQIPIDELFGNTKDTIRIVGNTALGPVTLDNCIRSQAKFSLFGSIDNARETYVGRIALLGGRVESQRPLEFSGVGVSIKDLEAWVGKPSTKIQLDYKEDSKEFTQVRIISTPEEPILVTTDLGELELSFNYKLGGDHIIQSRIEQTCKLEFRFTNPEPLENALRLCAALQDLVTIGVGAPVCIDTIWLASTQTPRPIEFYAPLLGVTNMNDAKPPQPLTMHFTFDALGGLTIIGNWLAMAQRYHVVIRSLTSDWYNPPYYAEDRFFHAVTAVETLERIRSGKQDFPFTYALKSLGNDVAEPFERLVGNINIWANSVGNARRDIIHRGLRDDKYHPLGLLSESIYYLVVLWLLREVHAETTAFNRVGEHQRFLLVAEQLRGMQL
jgi:hypothetical protein